MDTVDTIGFLLTGIVFVLAGIFAIIRGSFRVGFGGGRTGGSPLFHVKVEGTSATLLSLFLLIGGGLIAFPSILQTVSTERISANWAWMRMGGLVVVPIGMVFSSIVQSAILFGERIGKRGESDPSDTN